MPSFGNVTSGLESIGSHLDGVTEKARTTQGVLGETRKSVEGMNSALDSLDTKTDQSVERQERARRQIEDNTIAVGALEEIYQAVSDRGNNFSQDIQLQLELVRLGGQSLQDFLTLYGDAQIQLEDGNHKIRELFEGADYGIYAKRIRDLIDSVEEGGDKLGEVLAFLKENANSLTQGLQKAIEGFRKGEITLDRLLALLERARQDFAGEDAEALIKQILDGLQDGSLR